MTLVDFTRMRLFVLEQPSQTLMHKPRNDGQNKRRHPKSAILPPHFLSTLSWVGNASFIVHFTCSHQYRSRRLSNAIFFFFLLWFFLIYLCSLLLIPFLSLCSLQILKCRPWYFPYVPTTCFCLRSY